MTRQLKSVVQHIRRGDIVRVVWRDACEGTTDVTLSQMRPLGVLKCTDSTLVSVGRFLRVINERFILDDVFREESGSKVIYEKQAQGKWLSIPIGAVYQVTTLGDMDQIIAEQTKRRRTIFKQLRFFPRSKRLPNGELTRTLYMA